LYGGYPSDFKYLNSGLGGIKLAQRLEKPKFSFQAVNGTSNGVGRMDFFIAQNMFLGIKSRKNLRFLFFIFLDLNPLLSYTRHEKISDATVVKARDRQHLFHHSNLHT
jgi:hypothetical protein